MYQMYGSGLINDTCYDVTHNTDTFFVSNPYNGYYISMVMGNTVTSFDLFVWEINKLYPIHSYGILVINTQYN